VATKRSALDQVLDVIPDAPAGPVDVATAARKADAAIANAATELQITHEKLIKEPRVKVSLGPQYRPYFGNVMAVYLQGIPIFLPLDGKAYSVPKSYAMIIHEKRRAVDRFIMRKARMSSVQENYETFAGELKL
jgi:hypothetical protein